MFFFYPAQEKEPVAQKFPKFSEQVTYICVSKLHVPKMKLNRISNETQNEIVKTLMDFTIASPLLFLAIAFLYLVSFYHLSHPLFINFL